MTKFEIFEKSLFLHKRIAKARGMKVVCCPEQLILTRPMIIDRNDRSSYYNKYTGRHDYVRYRAIELAAKEIRNKYSAHEISQFSVAEAGVYRGNFAWIINKLFPECRCYLYDTFEGFSKEDMSVETSNGYTDQDILNKMEATFKQGGKEHLIKTVMKKMANPEQVTIRDGYFPDTVGDERNEQFCFVSLDMDLYKPILEGIRFFWPRMCGGGYIFIHDCINDELNGVYDAFVEAQKELGTIHHMPLPDASGTVVLCK